MSFINRWSIIIRTKKSKVKFIGIKKCLLAGPAWIMKKISFLLVNLSTRLQSVSISSNRKLWMAAIHNSSVTWHNSTFNCFCNEISILKFPRALHVFVLLPIPCSPVPALWLWPRKATKLQISLITCLSLGHSGAAQQGDRSSFSMIKKRKWHHPPSSAPAAMTITTRRALFFPGFCCCWIIPWGNDKHMKQLPYIRI